MTFVEDAFLHRRNGERAAQRLDRLLRLFLQPKARNREGWECDNGLRSF